MLYALLTLASLLSILFLIGCIRCAGKADDAAERAVANGEWPHLPRDGSRGHRK